MVQMGDCAQDDMPKCMAGDVVHIQLQRLSYRLRWQARQNTGQLIKHDLLSCSICICL